MKKPALERFAIKVVEGFSGSSWVCILNESKSFANTLSIDRNMYL
jgi:hypothetical protein